MTKVKTLKIAGLGVIIFITLLVLFALNMPLRLFAPSLFEDINITDLEGASAVSGHVWVAVEQVPGLIEINYKWCPSLSLTSWCVDASHSAFVIDGNLSLVGTSAIQVKNININNLDIAALNLGGGLVTGLINGQVRSAKIPLVSCFIKQIKDLDASMTMASLRVFGANAGAHQMQIVSDSSLDEEPNINVALQGDTFSGAVTLSSGRYDAKGEMLAPDSMVSMAQSFMRSLGDNRFGWEISGNVPC